MLKIHFSDKYLLLCTDGEYKLLKNINNITVVKENFETALMQFTGNADKKNTVFIHNDIDYLLSIIQNKFTVIEAAGGLVENDFNEILFIFRRGKWDLPKGKKEEGEDNAACAEREIEEETGVTNLSLINKLTETYHVYEERGKKILKISHWFQFKCPGRQNPVPQTEEDITEIRWFDKEKLDVPMSNTYETIKEVLIIKRFG